MNGDHPTPSTAAADAAAEPLLPSVDVSHERGYAALFQPRTCRPIAEMRRPCRSIGQLEIDAVNYAPYPSSAASQVQLYRIDDRQLVFEHVGPVYPAGFSRDDRWFAFGVVEDDAIVMAWVDCRSGLSRGRSRPVSAVATSWGAPLATWRGTSHSLLCRLRVAPCEPASEGDDRVEPVVHDTSDPSTGAVTVPLDRAVNDGCTVQLALIDADTGAVRDLGAPGLYRHVTCSPDGDHVLVERFVPAQDFSLDPLKWHIDTEVWAVDAGGGVSAVWRLDTLPSQGNPTREFGRPGRWYWHPTRPATVVAIDGSADGYAIVALDAPFDARPRPILTTAYPCVRFFHTTEGRVLLLEYDPVSSSRRLRVDGPEGGTVLAETPIAPGVDIFQSSWDSDVEEPPSGLRPAWRDGAVTGLAIQRGTSLFVTGADRADDLLRPFLATLDLESGALDVVFRSPDTSYERVVALLSDDARRLLVASETPSSLPRYVIRHADGSSARIGPSTRPGLTSRVGRRVLELTSTAHAPSQPSIRPGLAWHQFEVYLPPGDVQRPLPFLLWLSPWMPAMSVRRRTYRNQYLRLLDPALGLVLNGYGVAYLPPIHLAPFSTGKPDAPVTQMSESASAIVDALVASGLADPARIAVGGYCLGAYMTMMLLAHTRLFCAGIACAGMYNLAARPSGGWSTANRRFWDEPDVFVARSPIAGVRAITAPVLLFHGERDAVVPSTSSRDLYAALRHVGAVARYVSLPLENHRYECDVYVERFRLELAQWCDRHAKGVTAPARGRGPRTTRRRRAPVGAARLRRPSSGGRA